MKTNYTIWDRCALALAVILCGITVIEVKHINSKLLPVALKKPAVVKEVVVSSTSVTVKQSSPVKVYRYVDGDTFYCYINGKQDKIRMLCINTPERGKWLYKEASDHLRKLMEGKVVTLVSEGNRNRGNYGRLLRYAVAGGKNVNVEMVRSGFTKYYVKYGKSLKFHKEFLQAEKEAREAKRGLWSK